MAQTVQAGTTLDTIPPALGLNGGELFWIYQQGPTEATPWIGLSCTAAQIAQFAAGLAQPATTMRQLLSALSIQGVLIEVFDALPSDLTNTYNICWYHGATVSLGDVFVTGFLQPTLGYTNAQMQALFVLAGAVTAYASNSAATVRQLAAALAAQSELIALLEALPSDLTNTYSIAWNHGNYMTPLDPFITGFLQPTLGYSGSQITALFTLAYSFPA